MIESVEQGEYQYFTYDVMCDDCTVIFGLQAYPGADPDLFISYGNDNLPDKDNFDFKSAEAGSDVFTMEKSDPYFEKNKVSMKGTYVVAVYGKQAGGYILSAS